MNMKEMENEIIRMAKLLDYKGTCFVYTFMNSYLYGEGGIIARREEQP